MDSIAGPSKLPHRPAPTPSSTTPQIPRPPSLGNLSMVHLKDLGKMQRLADYMARSAISSNVFNDATIDNEIDKAAYSRGGQAKRIHFNASSTNPAYFADVMICDAQACTVECATKAGVSPRGVLRTEGEPFVHSVRDCLLHANGELEFRPTELDDYVFAYELPEVQDGVVVLFWRGASGGKVKVESSVCRWERCEVCRPFLQDEDIGKCEELDERGEEALEASNDESGKVDKGKGKARDDQPERPRMPRPFSRREHIQRQAVLNPPSSSRVAKEPPQPNDGNALGRAETVDQIALVPPTIPTSREAPIDQTALAAPSSTVPGKTSPPWYDHTALIAKFGGSIDNISPEYARLSPEDLEAIIMGLGFREVPAPHEYETSDQTEWAPVTTNQTGWAPATSPTPTETSSEWHDNTELARKYGALVEELPLEYFRLSPDMFEATMRSLGFQPKEEEWETSTGYEGSNNW